MKIWKIAHTITGLSLLLAVLGAIFLNPFIIITLASTVFIFQSAERIRKREEASP